jgi:choline dehydrogenase-like flavoprotein
MEKNKEFDVVIVGSGPGGGASAWALSKKGLKVLVLEAGPAYDPFSDYKLHTSGWEQQIFPHKVPVTGRQSFGALQVLTPENHDLRSWNHVSGLINPSQQRTSFGYHHVVGVGGSSLHFTGEAHRMNPSAMKIKTDFGVGADWPITYDELEPFYVDAEVLVGVAGPNNDKLRPRSVPYPQQFHPPSYTSQCIKKGFDSLGLDLVPNSLAVLSKPIDQRLNCNYCGGCLRGCPRTDKGSVDVTYIRKAVATGFCEIRSGCGVTRIERGFNDQIKGVHYNRNGTSNFVSTPILIISCGAIETPRLLLASDDLANESGEVGKNFMETLLWSSNGLHPEPLGSHRGLPVDTICWDYNGPNAIPGVIGGCRFSPSTAESDLVGPISYASRVVGGWGKSHKLKMRRLFGHAVSVTGIAESLPHPGSYIKLDPSLHDDFGIPLAQINSYLDEMAIKRIGFMAKTCRSILSNAGVSEIFEEFSSYDIFSSTHVFGTCRMGTDENDSVVNAECRSHRWKNLYIVDASVFPSTGGGESPGLTIQALALKASTGIN